MVVSGLCWDWTLRHLPGWLQLPRANPLWPPLEVQANVGGPNHRHRHPFGLSSGELEARPGLSLGQCWISSVGPRFPGPIPARG